MNYLCKTQKRGGEGLGHCYPNTDRASSPTSVYPKTGAASDCPLLKGAVNIFRIYCLGVTTVLAGKYLVCQLL